MADTLNDETISGNSWTELTAVSGVTEGEQFDVTNVSRPKGCARDVWLRISATDPGAGVEGGILLTTTKDPAHTYRVVESENKVWARSVSSNSATVNIQPV